MTAAPAPSFSVGKAVPIGAAVLLALFFGVIAWLVLAQALAAPAVDEEADAGISRALLFAIGGGAVVIALVFLSRIPAVLAQRFAVDAEGIHYRRGTRRLELPWSEIIAVRLLVERKDAPVTTVGARRSSTMISLQLAPRDRVHLELGQPGATRFAAQDADDERFTHAIELGPGAFLPPERNAEYAPQLQSALAALAPRAYEGVQVRVRGLLG